MPTIEPASGSEPGYVETPFTGHLRAKLAEACSGRPGTLFALIDGARVPKLWVTLPELEIEHVPLFRESPDEDIIHVTPFLARVDPEGLMPVWLTMEQIALEAALFLTAAAGLQELLAHFRRYLLIRDASGKSVYFRFYDSRVLPTFLEAATPAEARGFFGSVRRFFVWDSAAGTKESPVVFRGWNLPPDAQSLPLPTPPDVHHPFQLRPEMEGAFSEAAVESYERRCLAYLRERHGARLGGTSDEELRALVNRAKQIGSEAGLPSGRDATCLAELLVLGFTEDMKRRLLETQPKDRSRELEQMRDRAATASQGGPA
jgi:hypothetical protein